MENTRRELCVRLLPSVMGSDEDLQYATSYLVNDFLAVDAGSIGYQGNLSEQAAVRHVFLTHTHSDHLSSLPVLIENTLSDDREPLVVWGGASVLECLRQDLFNDRVWPQLDVFRSKRGPAVVLRELQPEVPVELEGLEILPVSMNHPVPTFSFLVDNGTHSVVLGGDTGPTKRLWELAHARENLAAVFIEAAFPNRLGELARAALHLTPEMFLKEWHKLDRDVRIYAIHLKARYRRLIIEELQALGIEQLGIGSTKERYCW